MSSALERSYHTRVHQHSSWVAARQPAEAASDFAEHLVLAMLGGYRRKPAADCLDGAATHLSCSLRAASVALVPTRTNFSTQSTFSAANMTVTATPQKPASMTMFANIMSACQ